MKIFHPLLCYYPSQAGGPANTLYWLNKSLNNKFFNVSIIASTFGLQVTQDCIDLHYQNNPKHKVKFIKSKTSFLIHSLRELIVCDTIQFSSIFFPPTLPLLALAFILQKKIVISPRGELYASALALKSLRKTVWLKVLRIFQHKIFFHATNEQEKEIINLHFQHSAGIKIIPNFIVLPQKIEVPVKKNILFIGRINPIKNLHVLIQAFSKINFETNNNSNLLIAGTARLDYELEYLKELRKLIKELKLEKRVIFCGQVENKKKQELIASSYFVVLPSKSENFGNVVLEALAQGTPVIASKNTPWEILEEVKAGYWIDPSNQSITYVLQKVLQLSTEEYQVMRNKAYKLCNEFFDINKNIKHWENFYNNLKTK